MNYKKITLLLLAFLFLYSCNNAKNALQGKKRSDNSDEFLVEKKNPLTMPPDINELPIPTDQEDLANKNDDEKLEVIKNLEVSESDTTNENNSLEDSILEKIKD